MGFTGRTYYANFEYFKTWSNNMAYILGFIYADGNLRNNQLRIRISTSDIDILDKIKAEIQYDGEIKIETATIKGIDKKYEYANLTICSKDMVEDLRSFGLTDNKSLTKQFPKVPDEYLTDFIRGYFDGNGSVGIHQKSQIRTRFFSGSKDMIDNINSYFHNNFNFRIMNVSSAKRRVLFDICYSTNDSIRLYDVLYKDAGMFLNRKKSKFEEAINNRK